MKTILVLLFALLILQARAFAGLDTDVPQTNRVILAPGSWNPSADETQKALTAIQSFLETRNSTNAWDKKEIEKILKHTKEYRVQFTGIIHDGKKLIWCNFFPNEKGFDYWKQQKVVVMDGGFWFWRIMYDPNTQNCLNLEINGYA